MNPVIYIEAIRRMIHQGVWFVTSSPRLYLSTVQLRADEVDKTLHFVIRNTYPYNTPILPLRASIYKYDILIADVKLYAKSKHYSRVRSPNLLVK